MFHERTKPNDIRMHFITYVITQGVIDMKKISTMDNLVDMMTKLISMVIFEHYLDLIGIGIQMPFHGCNSKVT